MRTVFHLEKFPHFLARVVALNRLYAPDDPVHEHLMAASGPIAEGPEGWREAERTRRILHTIHRHFPEQAPVHEQAAYLVLQFSGLEPFPEANHRTGWDLTAEILQHAGHELTATVAEGQALGIRLWEEIQEAGVPADGHLHHEHTLTWLGAWFHDRIA